MKESVKATVPRQVYQDMRLSKIACADLTATPRNIKQVENARYLTNKTSDRSYGNLSSFADHVVYLENMAKSEDFFVRRVITGPGRVPSVICYTNEQLADIRRFCCAGPAAQNTVLGIDKTYNLGQVHVTPTVFKHLAVLKRTTNDHPIMAGPILLHGSSDHHTFAEFFYHLRSHLGINLPSPIVGSDDEKAIKSSISQVWPATKKLTCVRHIKNNLKDYLTKKVGVNEKVKSALVSTVFGKEGVASADNTVLFEIRKSQALQAAGSVSSVYKDYLNVHILPKLYENLQACETPGFGSLLEWTNNNAESLNNVLKMAVNWTPQALVALVEKLRGVVMGYSTEVERAIAGLGDYKLCDEYMKFHVPTNIWAGRTAEQRQRHLKRFLNTIKPSSSKLSLTSDGSRSFLLPKNGGKKPGQIKRKRAAKTKTNKKKPHETSTKGSHVDQTHGKLIF